jgi:Zn-dependent M28 family amino/carboxypeptidase
MSMSKFVATALAVCLTGCGGPPKKPTPIAPTPAPEVPTPAPEPKQPGPISPVPTSIASPAAADMSATAAARKVSPASVPAPRAKTPIADAYRDVTAKILAAGTSGRSAFGRLAYLTDHIGARIAGSKKLDEAIAWAQKSFAADGQENVHAEKAMVSHWERGELDLQMLTPATHALHGLALGLAPGTGKKGITAQVVIIDDFDQLKALGVKGVKGKIVLFNHAMPPYTEEKGSGYGESSAFRVRGPGAASRLGAVAVLTRSATARSLGTPHTGVTLFDVPKGDKEIPAVAITLEDADLITRLAAEGPVTLKLVSGARNLGKVPSANVIAELRGREKPDEVVVLAAHLVSWDVGPGAQDAGAGVVIMMEALAILRRGGWVPKRTIRVVLYTNEEHGIDGAIAYGKDHAGELGKHVAAIESDGGSFKPLGLSYEGKADAPAYARLADLITLLAPLGATSLEASHSGTDLIPLVAAGVPSLGHRTDGSTYFDYHHTDADTLDKVDPTFLQQNAAMMAVVAYVLADMPERLGQ